MGIFDFFKKKPKIIENDNNISNTKIIEEDIYRGIDMAFDWFKKRNPTLEIICDEETMKEWYDFFKWCYAQDGASGEAENFIKESKSPEFDFEISSLMEKAINECSGWWEKYNTEHQDVAEENFRDKCNKCNGGFLDDEFEKVCEDCEGTGYDPEDEEGHWHYYDEAFNKISESVDKSSFKKLSKISLKDIDEFKEDSNRVNIDETNDIGKITHYKGKPFTGIGFILTDGLIDKEITFENGLKHGIFKSYNNGKLFYEAIYKNDNFVEVIRGFAADGKTSLDEKKLRIMKSVIKKLHEKN